VTASRFWRPCAQLVTSEGVITNIDGDGLRFDWAIQRDNTTTPDTARISIYNLAPALASAILSTWQALSAASGYLVQFLIGWDRVPQVVITGDVWDLVADKRTATDTITILQLGDGQRAQRDQVVGKSFAGVKIDTVLDYLVQFPPATVDAGGGGLGLIYPPESKALIKAASALLPVQTWGNIPAGANTREAIDVVMATLGLEWRVHNGAFIVLRGGLINRPPVILRPGTGLVSYERRNDGGISLEALASTDIEPGSQILVQDNAGRPFGAGVFRVERCSWRGSTSSESLMSIDARKALI